MRVQVRDVRIFFDVEGAKLVPDGPRMREVPTLIALHGGPGVDHSGFKPMLSPLRDVAQIIYVDLRGHGRSDRSGPANWTLEEWARDLRAFCEALEIERPVLLGQSFGCEVAMTYALHFPDALAGLVLANATARLRMDRVLSAFERFGGAPARQAAEQFWELPTAETTRQYMSVCAPLYYNNPPPAEIFSRAIFNDEVSAHYNACGGEAHTMNLLPHLQRISCEVLLLAGTDDPITTIEDARDIVRATPAGLVQLHEFEGTRHSVLRDRSEQALELIRQFIETRCASCE